MQEIGLGALHANVATSGLSAGIGCGCSGLIASRLAPTMISVVHKFCIQRKTCGSEPARDEASSYNPLSDSENARLVAAHKNANPKVGVLFSSSEA
jgi:hypothetical protein